MKIQIGLKIYIWNDFVLIPVYTALKICQKYFMWDKTKYCIFYSVSLKILPYDCNACECIHVCF